MDDYVGKGSCISPQKTASARYRSLHPVYRQFNLDSTLQTQVCLQPLYRAVFAIRQNKACGYWQSPLLHLTVCGERGVSECWLELPPLNTQTQLYIVVPVWGKERCIAPLTPPLTLPPKQSHTHRQYPGHSSSTVAEGNVAGTVPADAQGTKTKCPPGERGVNGNGQIKRWEGSSQEEAAWLSLRVLRCKSVAVSTCWDTELNLSFPLCQNICEALSISKPKKQMLTVL